MYIYTIIYVYIYTHAIIYVYITLQTVVLTKKLEDLLRTSLHIYQLLDIYIYIPSFCFSKQFNYNNYIDWGLSVNINR